MDTAASCATFFGHFQHQLCCSPSERRGPNHSITFNGSKLSFHVPTPSPPTNLSKPQLCRGRVSSPAGRSCCLLQSLYLGYLTCRKRLTQQAWSAQTLHSHGKVLSLGLALGYLQRWVLSTWNILPDKIICLCLRS